PRVGRRNHCQREREQAAGGVPGGLPHPLHRASPPAVPVVLECCERYCGSTRATLRVLVCAGEPPSKWSAVGAASSPRSKPVISQRDTENRELFAFPCASVSLR